jgi:hypothetical protein
MLYAKQAGTYPMTQLRPLLHDEQAGNYTGRYILKILCGQMLGVCFTGCGSIFILKLNRRWCVCCIYCHGTLVRAIVSDIASSAFDGSFDRSTTLGYLPGTSREIYLAAEMIIICCGEIVVMH